MMPLHHGTLELIRGGIVEAEHHFSYGLCGTKHQGEEAACEAGRLFFPRSSVKPMQAAFVFESLTAHGLSPQDFPPEAWLIGMASHAGTAQHQRWVRWWLDTFKLPEAALACGVHPPIDSRVLRHDESAHVLHHNCSGKHAAVLALCKVAGWPMEGYTTPEHPYSRAFRLWFETQMGKQAATTLHWAADGCQLQTPALALEAFTRLAQRFGEGHPFARRYLPLIKKHPQLLAGEGRLDTQIAQLADSPLVSKCGAEGCIVLWQLETRQALVIKVWDGAAYARDVITLSLLKHLGWLDDETGETLIIQRKRSIYERCTATPKFRFV